MWCTPIISHSKLVQCGRSLNFIKSCRISSTYITGLGSGIHMSLALSKTWRNCQLHEHELEFPFPGYCGFPFPWPNKECHPTGITENIISCCTGTCKDVYFMCLFLLAATELPGAATPTSFRGASSVRRSGAVSLCGGGPFSPTSEHGRGEETLCGGCVEAGNWNFIPCGHMRGIAEFYFVFFSSCIFMQTIYRGV